MEVTFTRSLAVETLVQTGGSVNSDKESCRVLGSVFSALGGVPDGTGSDP